MCGGETWGVWGRKQPFWLKARVVTFDSLFRCRVSTIRGGKKSSFLGSLLCVWKAALRPREESRPALLLLWTEWKWLAEAGGPADEEKQRWPTWLIDDSSNKHRASSLPHYWAKRWRRHAAQLPASLSQRLTRRRVSQLLLLLLREFKVENARKHMREKKVTFDVSTAVIHRLLI